RISGVAGLVDATFEAQGNGVDLGSLKAKAEVRSHRVVATRCSLENVDLKANVANKTLSLSGISAGTAGQLNLNGSSDLSANPHYHLLLTTKRLAVAKACVAATVPTELNLSATADGRGL